MTILDITFLFSVWAILILLFISLFSGGNSRCSEYELYGPDGSDEWERKQMGLSPEDYDKYRNHK